MSEERIFFDGGTEIFRRDGKLFIRYDGGYHDFQLREHEITEEEAAKAQRGDREAYEVIIASQQRAEAAKRV